MSWDGGREAARVMADALPLLARARFVNVETVVHGQPDPDKTPPGVDVAAYLERHGVRASLDARRSVDVGATLLNR